MISCSLLDLKFYVAMNYRRESKREVALSFSLALDHFISAR